MIAVQTTSGAALFEMPTFLVGQFFVRLKLDVSVSPITPAAESQVITIEPKTFYTDADVMALFADADGKALLKDAENRIETEWKTYLDAGEMTPLAYYRRIRGMTQQELAAKAGSRQPYVSRIESGKQDMSKAQAKKLAPVLDIEWHQLIT